MNALRQVQIQCEWLGNEEARRLVGLGRTTLYRLIKTGESGYQWQRELTPRSSPPTAPPRSRPATPAPEYGRASSIITQDLVGGIRALATFGPAVLHSYLTMPRIRSKELRKRKALAAIALPKLAVGKRRRKLSPL